MGLRNQHAKAVRRKPVKLVWAGILRGNVQLGARQMNETRLPGIDLADSLTSRLPGLGHSAAQHFLGSSEAGSDGSNSLLMCRECLVSPLLVLALLDSGRLHGGRIVFVGFVVGFGGS